MNFLLRIDIGVGAQSPTLAYFRQVRSSHCDIESSVPLSAQYQAEYPTSYLLLKQYSLCEIDLLTHYLLFLHCQIIPPSCIKMQAMRKVLGVQSSSDFHDHGLQLLVPDPTNTEELQVKRNVESVCLLMIQFPV